MLFKSFGKKPKFGGADTPKQNIYLKVADGQTVNAVLRGEIYSYFQKWENGKADVVVEGTPGAKPRFRVNAVIFENGKFTAKIWEFGLLVYEELAMIHEFVPITTTKIKISREGTLLATQWEVKAMIKEEEKLTPKQLQEIEQVELHILNKEPKAATPPPQDRADEWNGF